MSAYFDDDDFRTMSYFDLFDLIAGRLEGPEQLERANKAMAELWRRRNRYVRRVCTAIKGHVISPVNEARLLPFIFSNVKRKASKFRPRKDGLREELQSVNEWFNLTICDSFLRGSDDGQLMAQIARRGESGQALKVAEKALWEIQRRHWKSVLIYCRSLVRGTFDAGVADDITQVAFLKVFNNAKTYDNKGLTDRGKLKGLTRMWIKTIARNLYFDEIGKLGPEMLIHFDRLEALEALLWKCEAWPGFVAPSAEQEFERGLDPEGEPGDPHLKCKRDALSEAPTVRERDILMAAGQPEEERDDAQRRVEAAYGITDDNRRTILKRARIKVDDYRAAHCDVCRLRILKKRRRGREE